MAVTCDGTISPATVMPTETEFEDMPDAVAGRAQLDAAMAKVGQDEQAAFWEAVRRCYASAAGDDSPPS